MYYECVVNLYVFRETPPDGQELYEFNDVTWNTTCMKETIVVII